MKEATATAATSKVTSRAAPRGVRSFSIWGGLFCASIVVGCVLIADPVAQMPFSDSFSYVKTALDFSRTGHLVYNGWATAMLGWLIPWGALFIRIFGFSFTLMRLSMLPLVVATVILFHGILRRFGIHPGNAVFGTLALCLSPIFLPSAASFMTDIPGLLVIFLCVSMCQRAVAARVDRAAIAWLCFAALVNVAGGTVRQIAWLGALVMVPSTAWFLRERRGMKIAGTVLWVLSFAGVVACLQWFNRQPYSVPEHIIWAPVRPMMALHLAAQLVKTVFCFSLVIFPILVVWLPTARRLDRRAWMRFAAAMGLLIALGISAYAAGRIQTWAMPWLLYLMAEQSSRFPGIFGMTSTAVNLWVRVAISVVVIGTAILAGEQIAGFRPSVRSGSGREGPGWNSVVWILGPFSVSYILLLMPRGAFDQIQDRYLVVLAPVAIVFLVRLYQERIGAKLPAIGWIVLVLFAVYSVAGIHDFFAESRAQVQAIQMVVRSGVPRISIQAGFPSDGWVQIQNGGHINEPRLLVPAGAYNPFIPYVTIPDKCVNGFTRFTPIISPRYFVLFPWLKNPQDQPPAWCFKPSKYPPVHYRVWLPPFDATLSVKELSNRP